MSRLEISDNQILRIYNSGISTYGGISRELGCSRTAIKVRMKRMGLASTNKPERRDVDVNFLN